MSALKYSTFKCPGCHQPLIRKRIRKEIFLWCGYGPCELVRANDGAPGETEEKAFELLEKTVLCEIGARAWMKTEIARIEAENLEWKRRAMGSRYAP